MASLVAPGAGLGGRIVAAGSQSRELFARMLGIDRLGAPFAVTAVAWMDHVLEVAVATGGERPEVLRIEAKAPESKGLVSTDRLNLFFRGSDADARLSATVAAHARRTLGDWSIERLAEAIGADPELGKPGQPMPPGVDESNRPRSLLDTWGHEDAFADFFAGGELARGQLDSIDPGRLFRFVQHCDHECLQVNPHTVAPVVSLVSYPWDDRLRESGSLDAEQPERDFDPEGMVTTDLNEDDVIRGSSKLKEVLEYAASRPDPENKPIFFSNTCVPAMTGEDVESVVRQVEARSSRKIFYLTVSARSMTTVFRGWTVDRRLVAEKQAGPPEPRSVNLLGFPPTRASRELEELLRAIGIEVNARVLPDLVPELIERMPRAALSVIYPNSTWQHHYDQLTFESRTPHIMPPAPYGFRGTRQWLSDIAAALGHPCDVDGAMERLGAELKPRYEALGKRAAERRLGFVVRDRETYYLTTPSRTWGVPLVSLLEEMGFGLDILVGVSAAKLAAEKARELRSSFQAPQRHTIRAFDSFPFLRHRLKESPSHAFLSYQFFDWRLTSAGKGTFSIQQFEMGMAGAVRTLERLLRVCSTSFFRRYGDYLGRTNEGLRLEAAAPIGNET